MSETEDPFVLRQMQVLEQRVGQLERQAAACDPDAMFTLGVSDTVVRFIEGRLRDPDRVRRFGELLGRINDAGFAFRTRCSCRRKV